MGQHGKKARNPKNRSKSRAGSGAMKRAIREEEGEKMEDARPALESHIFGLELMREGNYVDALYQFNLARDILTFLEEDDIYFPIDIPRCCAACLLKIEPVNYRAVIGECEMSLRLNPGNTVVLGYLEEAKIGLTDMAKGQDVMARMASDSLMEKRCAGCHCELNSDSDNSDEHDWQCTDSINLTGGSSPAGSTEDEFTPDLNEAGFDPDQPFFEESAQEAWRAYMEGLQNDMALPSAYEVKFQASAYLLRNDFAEAMS